MTCNHQSVFNFYQTESYDLLLRVVVSLGVATSLILCFTRKYVTMKPILNQIKMKNMSRALKVYYNLS